MPRPRRVSNLHKVRRKNAKKEFARGGKLGDETSDALIKCKLFAAFLTGRSERPFDPTHAIYFADANRTQTGAGIVTECPLGVRRPVFPSMRKETMLLVSRLAQISQ